MVNEYGNDHAADTTIVRAHLINSNYNNDIIFIIDIIVNIINNHILYILLLFITISTTASQNITLLTRITAATTYIHGWVGKEVEPLLAPVDDNSHSNLKGENLFK